MDETRALAPSSENIPAQSGYPVAQADTLDIQIRTAREKPRDLKQVKATIREHISDPELAAQMWYTLPRGGKQIVGPSVRLSEVLAQAWGNIRIISHVVETTATTVTARGIAIDLETNTGISSDATVQIHGRGSVDDVKQAHMRAQAVARRNATFQAIPGAYARIAMQRAMDVYKQEPLEKRLDNMLEWFRDRGVSESTILKTLHVESVDEITNHDLEKIRGMANRIVEENRDAKRELRQQEDEEEYEEAVEATTPAPKRQKSAKPREDLELTPPADDAKVNAMEIEAKKKFKTKFGAVWDAAMEAAAGNVETLTLILSAPEAIVCASLEEDDPTAALLLIAKAAKAAPDGAPAPA